MRYKYKIYTNEEKFIINTAKFAIEIYFDRNRKVFICKKLDGLYNYNYNEINDVEILFDLEKKHSLIKNLQKIKYIFDFIGGEPIDEHKDECKMLGIDVHYSFPTDNATIIRIEAIVDYILNKYNIDNEELFNYDLNDKELIKYLLNFDFDLLYEEAPEQFQKEEIIETVLEQSYYIENTEIFETSKERIIQFLNSNLKGRLRINHEFVDEELVKLFKEKKVVYERIDD
ncbi:MAG: hypothetical protein ACLT40_00635 [Fusobacterium sp.]